MQFGDRRSRTRGLVAALPALTHLPGLVHPWLGGSSSGLPTSTLLSLPDALTSPTTTGTPTGDFISWAAPGSADPLLLVRREAGPSASARPVLELLGSDMGVAAVWMMRGGNRLLRSSGCSPSDTTAGERGGDPESPPSRGPGPGAAPPRPPGRILTGQVLLPVPVAIQAGGEEIRLRLGLGGISLGAGSSGP